MILQAIRIRNVGKFGKKGLAIENIPSGLSMLSQPNEFGKSTLLRALKIVLFEKHSSKKRDIENIAFATGVAPLIEIDFKWGHEGYRLRKQFLRQQFAELELLSTGALLKANDEANDWMIEKIGATTKPQEGPTGLLWCEQGESMKSPDGGEPGKRMLSNLLEYEVSHITSGTKSDILLKRIEDELKKHITAHNTPKKNRNTKEPSYRSRKQRVRLTKLKKRKEN